jgi:hypothetical protein
VTFYLWLADRLIDAWLQGIEGHPKLQAYYKRRAEVEAKEAAEKAAAEQAAK